MEAVGLPYVDVVLRWMPVFLVYWRGHNFSLIFGTLADAPQSPVRVKTPVLATETMSRA